MEKLFLAIKDELYPHEKIDLKGKDHIKMRLYSQCFVNTSKKPKDAYIQIRRKISYARNWFESKPYMSIPSPYGYFSDEKTGIRFFRLFDFDKKVDISEQKKSLMNLIYKEATQWRKGLLNVNKQELIEKHGMLLREFGDEGLKKWFLRVSVKIYSTWEGGNK